jgi:hypothetical protein
MKAATRSTRSETKRSATRRARPAGVRATAAGPRVALTPEQRHAMIAEAAYYRAERRGFAPGAELQDWLAAEAEIDHALAEPTLLEHQLAHSDT